MTQWPRWARRTAAGSLVHYVQLGLVNRLLLDVPGTSAQPPWYQLERIYQALAAADIGYADEPISSEPGLQDIRPPDQVLVNPRIGTCLDVVVTAAGACLDAGLHPWVVVVDPVERRGPSHALLLVWLGGGWAGEPDPDYPRHGEDPVIGSSPVEILRNLRPTAAQQGGWAIVDVAKVARRSTIDEPVTFDDAVASGAAMLTGGRWSWGIGVDIGLGFRAADSLRVQSGVELVPLVEGYRPPRTSGPLQQLRASSGRGRFQGRDELEVLHDWCLAPDAAGSESVSRVAIVHGVGGAGKTHLAAELCDRLSSENWYTGFLPNPRLRDGSRRDLDPTALAWLATVVSPLLVVVDYADAARHADVLNLLNALNGRRSRTRVLLTARTSGSQHVGAGSTWWDTLLDELTVPVRQFPHIELAERHPSERGVLRQALTAFGGDPAAASAILERPHTDRWTTLDLVMLAWLEAHAVAEHPNKRSELYEAILEHELPYWQQAIAKRGGKNVPDKMLRQAGACVTLLAPQSARTAKVLAAVPSLSAGGDPLAPSERAEEIAEAMHDVLPPDAGDGSLAIRPDPIGDHLVVSVFGADPELFRRCLSVVQAQKDVTHSVEQINALVTISRAEQNEPEVAARLAADALEQTPHLWRLAAAIGSSIGGPLLTALIRLADRSDSPLPLAELAGEIPLGHTSLRRLGLVASQRVMPAPPADPTAQEAFAEYATMLNNLALRQAENGDRLAAMEPITQAVHIYRRLAEDNPAGFLPGLAASLNNLSNRQSELSYWRAALESITEAVEIRRRLVEANPAGFLPDLAASLNNLSNRQSELGDRGPALESVIESVEIRRRLVKANPAGFLPDLAMSLNNLSNRQGEVGDRHAALESITEAVSIYRGLAEANPAAFMSNLAAALNNLSGCQGELGDWRAALESITQAANIYRQLAEANPAAFMSNLAAALNNLSGCQGELGDWRAALESITQAVDIYRQLAEANPAAFMPNLAATLNNLSNRQSELGDRHAALESITEAVEICRQVVETNPAGFLPDFAMSLNNLSNRQSELGEREAALRSAIASVNLYRRLAEASPATFLPDLAGALNNLCGCQSEVGDRRAALESITQAVDLYRRLAEANPAAFLPGLAMSLNNLSNHQSEVGDRHAALESVTEAVEIRRRLVEANPAAFLPGLAMSLNNLANRQGGLGDRPAALESITEAVDVYRRLVEANPAAFLPNLAASLNNLSGCQGNVGDRHAALESITEAVDVYRRLVEANPAAFLPNLAGALNNLSGRQGSVGDHEVALESITEAVDFYRRLVEDNAAAFLPNLAGALNNLSNRHSELGDRPAALVSITEAVEIRRRLVETNPIAFLPDLAESLNNLSVCQGELGDRHAALVSITEAVEIRRRLVETNPAAFISGLAASLSNLSSRQYDLGDRHAVLETITEAVDLYRRLVEDNPTAFLPGLVGSLKNLVVLHSILGKEQTGIAVINDIAISLSPGLSVEVVLIAVWWYLEAGSYGLALDEMVRAVDAAQKETDPRWRGHARRAVRATAEQWPDRTVIASAALPFWVTGPMSDDLIDVLQQWLVASDWSVKENIVRQSAILGSPEGKKAIEIALLLYPDLPGIVDLDNLLQAISANGMDSVFGILRATEQHAVLLNEWLLKPTWSESQKFAEQHPELLLDPRTGVILKADLEDPVVAQHAGIARLSSTMDLSAVYEIVVDRSHAIDTVLELVATGKLDTVVDLMAAAPALGETPFIGPFLLAVLISGEIISPPGSDHADTTPSALMRLAREQGTDLQRRGAAARLRRLARSAGTDNERGASFIQLAEILDTEHDTIT